MTVYEPKQREICCTQIRDRQAQHCICDNYLYDELCRSFIYDNFACQKGKGNHLFIKRLKEHLRQYYVENNRNNEGYVLTCDIKKFFNNIPHDYAKQAIRKRVKMPEVVAFVDMVIDSYEGDVGFYPGSQVIQLVALAVLDDFDHCIKEELRIKHYMRYNDDFVLIHKDKKYLRYCQKKIEQELGKIGLNLNPKKTKIVPLSKGFKMLHWRFTLKKTGKIILYVEKSKISRQRKKLKKMAERVKNGEIPFSDIEDNMRSWEDNMRQGCTYHVIRKMRRYVKELEEYIYGETYTD